MVPVDLQSNNHFDKVSVCVWREIFLKNHQYKILPYEVFSLVMQYIFARNSLWYCTFLTKEYILVLSFNVSSLLCWIRKYSYCRKRVIQFKYSRFVQQTIFLLRFSSSFFWGNMNRIVITKSQYQKEIDWIFPVFWVRIPCCKTCCVCRMTGVNKGNSSCEVKVNFMTKYYKRHSMSICWDDNFLDISVGLGCKKHGFTLGS